MHTARNNKIDLTRLATDIKAWGRELGFQRIGIADVELGDAETRLLNWLDRERHGEMHYMESHGPRRSRPQELQPGTLRVISARMDYLPGHAADSEAVMHNPSLGFISRYALGRDYHKVMRGRLQKLAERIESKVGPFQYRAFTDSAPVLEKALAEKAGLGWIGKHTNLIDKQTGSWFFLGELYTDLPLPADAPAQNHCGTRPACLDGCQRVCPWNRFARPTTEPDFAPRHDLDAPELIRLFSWTEEEFMKYTEGSAIRRIGYECWLRNIAVALGNAPTSGAIVNALRIRSDYPSELVREHVRWALARHR